MSSCPTKTPSSLLSANRNLALNFRSVPAQKIREYRKLATRFSLMKDTGKVMGRPLKTEGKRTKKIGARFTEDEYRVILELERTFGIRKTDLVRNRLLQNSIELVINAKEMIRALDSVGTELGRCGNNINQLAKYANILTNKRVLSPVVIERFNLLFEQYIGNQKELDTTLRRIIRVLGK
ncbi:MAG: Bacterial mobilization protein MobC [Mucilaginibacter sp.]|nr:Bacterial mobilization protein MobC [Mucilaginibacter sp.]